VVTAVLAGAVPQLMVTDPPYGVEYDPAWRHRWGVNNSARKDKIQNDEVADWAPAWSLFPGEIAYVWHGALRSTIVAESLFKVGFAIRAQVIWAKERLVMSKGDYHWQHEPCWYVVRKKATGPATASKPPSGTFRVAGRTLTRGMLPKSPWNACADRC
jgi:hypothetical protein